MSHFHRPIFLSRDTERGPPYELRPSFNGIELKRIERQQSQEGMTGLVLVLRALVGTYTETNLEEALEMTPQKKVDNWASRVLGPSIQWFREQFFAETKA